MKKSIVLVLALALAGNVYARSGGPIYSTGEVPMKADLQIGDNSIVNSKGDTGISVDTSGNVTVAGTLASGAIAPASISTPGAGLIGGNLTVTGNVTTATGTVSAEQLTSTDDTYIADKLGIGTNAPVNPLHIAGADTRVKYSETDTGVEFTAGVQSSDFIFQEVGASNPALFLETGGAVGINTNNPSATFHVAGGNIKFDSLPEYGTQGEGDAALAAGRVFIALTNGVQSLCIAD